MHDIALDPALVELATTQHGMFTTWQAQRLGMERRSLAHAVAAGELRHPARGLYAVSALVDPTAEGWHRQLCAGALLIYPDAVLAGISAVLAWDVVVWGGDLARPAICRPVDRSIGTRGIHVRPARGGVGVSSLGPTQPLPDALVQHAIDHGVGPGVVSADAALHAGLVTVESLGEALARVEKWPHASRARSMSVLVDGRSESVGESRTRVVLTAAGLRLVPQVTIHDRSGRFVARVDFVVEGTKVVVEFDGRVKYGHDPRALWDEKRREDSLRRLGYVVVRLTWADLETPGRAAGLVRAALRMAA